MGREAETGGPRRLVFSRPEHLQQQGLWLMIAGVVVIVIALGLVVGLAFTSVDLGQFGIQVFGTLPSILGVALIGVGWSQRRGPEKVIIHPAGVEIVTRTESQRYRWKELGCARIKDGGLGDHKYLILHDIEGKEVAQISNAIRNFTRMQELIQKRVSEEAPEQDLEIRRKAGNRMALLTGGMGLLMVCGSGFMAWTTWDENQATELLQSQGQEGQADIQELVVAPNGRTKRVYFQVTGESGETADHNVEVDAVTYELLKQEEAQQVPVMFVPGKPQYARLLRGQVEDDETPGGYLMAAFCLAVGLFMLVGGILQHFGWDVKLDDKTGKASITRYGRPLKSKT